MKKRGRVKNAGTTQKKVIGRPFQKGNPGRPKGSLNHNTVEFKKWCREATSQAMFLETLLKRLRKGSLKSDLVRTLLAYGHGRPAIAVDVTMDFNPRDYMSRDDEAPDD